MFAAMLLSAVGTAGAKPFSLAVSFVDAQHGWLSGADGMMFVVWVTSDDGRTLKPQAARPVAGGGATHLASTSRSIALWTNDYGVRRTTIGGKTWTYPPQRPLGIPRDLHFASPRLACATGAFGSAGDGGSICRSTDGGASWRSAKTVHSHDGNQFGSLSCPAPQRCYVLGSGDLTGLWVTVDGGSHWAKRKLPGGGGSLWYSTVVFPTAYTGRLTTLHDVQDTV